MHCLDIEVCIEVCESIVSILQCFHQPLYHPSVDGLYNVLPMLPACYYRYPVFLALFTPKLERTLQYTPLVTDTYTENHSNLNDPDSLSESVRWTLSRPPGSLLQADCIPSTADLVQLLVLAHRQHPRECRRVSLCIPKNANSLTEWLVNSNEQFRMSSAQIVVDRAPLFSALGHFLLFRSTINGVHPPLSKFLIIEFLVVYMAFFKFELSSLINQSTSLFAFALDFLTFWSSWETHNERVCLAYPQVVFDTVFLTLDFAYQLMSGKVGLLRFGSAQQREFQLVISVL